MKNLLFIFLFLFWHFDSQSQNLVPNPSFESVTDCFPYPDSLSCISWFSPSDGTPDNFSSCFNPNYPDFGVPNNLLGYQFPHSGQAYAGAKVIFPLLGLGNKLNKEMSL